MLANIEAHCLCLQKLWDCALVQVDSPLSHYAHLGTTRFTKTYKTFPVHEEHSVVHDH